MSKMSPAEQREHNNSILSVINLLKSGDNKDHNYLASQLNDILPSLKIAKEEGYSFHHVIKANGNVVSSWKFDMDDLDELERFIDNYNVNDICFGSPEDYDLPEVFDKHSLNEELFIAQ